ncbi:hypothetical protein, partial [Rhodococcus opacus]|uniref:hypothetical protein n=1 Tax=Rhodococcus opacus TaxID=37919 RepID=UPI001A7E0532
TMPVADPATSHRIGLSCLTIRQTGHRLEANAGWTVGLFRQNVSRRRPGVDLRTIPHCMTRGPTR